MPDSGAGVRASRRRIVNQDGGRTTAAPVRPGHAPQLPTVQPQPTATAGHRPPADGRAGAAPARQPRPTGDGNGGTAVTSELESLLALQERDGALDRLLHRHQTLPERDALHEAEADAAALDARLSRDGAERDGVAREEQQLDDEARSLAGKATEVEARMYSGEVSSPQELQAMQSDVEQLRRHQRTVENRELELMEAREPLDADARRARAAPLGARASSTRIAAALADGRSRDHRRDAGRARGPRRASPAGIDERLVKEYERCRALAQGRRASRASSAPPARVVTSRSPPSRPSRSSSSGGHPLAHCDNCGAILVP